MSSINAEGIALIKHYEGLKLEASLASGDRITVGYGHTGRGIRLGDQVTEAEADRLLATDLAWIEEAISGRVRLALNDNEFSALASLVFDIGIRRFSESALLNMLNKGEKLRAADAMTWLRRSDRRGADEAVPGVPERRWAEKALFLRAPGDG